MRSNGHVFPALALPVIEDCDKKRLVDPRTITETLAMLAKRGLASEDAMQLLVRLFYVDLDEVRN